MTPSDNESSSLGYKLGTIDTKIDQIISSLPHINRRVDGMDRRVSTLEQAKWKQAGFVSAITFGITLFGVFFARKLGL